MSVDRVSGYPDYTQAGVNKNIPWAFGREYQKKFYKTSPIPLMTNSDFTADIKKQGDKVIIPTIPTITIRDLKVGGTMVMENPESPSIEFNVSRANYFFFGLDKITLKQMLDGKDYMDRCTADAGQQMSTFIGQKFMDDIYNKGAAENRGASAGVETGGLNMGATGTPVVCTPSSILKYIIAAEIVCDEQNLPDDGRFITLPSIARGVLQHSDLKDISLTGDTVTELRHGLLNKPIGKFKVLISNQVNKVTDGANLCYNIPFGHVSGIAFATQMTDMVYFDKLETSNGQAMRGTNVYDWKVVTPKAFGNLYATFDLGL